jgi:hypothetical protein
MNIGSSRLKRRSRENESGCELELRVLPSTRSAAAWVSPTPGAGREIQAAASCGELRRAFLVAGFALAIGFAGCALTQQASVSGQNCCPFPGAKLCSKLTPGTSGQIDLRYLNPNAQWTQYKKVMIEP